MIVDMKGSSSFTSFTKGWTFRSNLPLLTGLLIGMLMTTTYYYLYDTDTCSPLLLNTKTRKSINPISSNTDQKKIDTTHTTSALTSVKPKTSHFNYDFRPYFVYSELGFKYHLIVAVKTSEDRLNTLCIAINNTWIIDLPKVIFFTPYSKNQDFHEKYVRSLNLDVVQLPDIFPESPDSEFSFRIMQHIKDHYVNSYNWFVMVSDEAYIGADNLIEYLHSLDSSQDFYLGHPTKMTEQLHSSKNTDEILPLSHYCFEQSGIVLSRSVMLKVTPDLSTKGSFGMVLAKVVYEMTGLECVSYLNMGQLFIVEQVNNVSPEELDKRLNLRESLSIYPVTSASKMLRIHKYFLEIKLQAKYSKMHTHQDQIQQMQIKLPHGVPEKTLHWPVGYPAPFKPGSRFEVIPWTFFDVEYMYGQSDVEPVSKHSYAYEKDRVYIMDTVAKAIKRNHGNAGFRLLNGYRRVDPTRGAEYIVDVEAQNDAGVNKPLKRIQLLRPFTKIEPLPMPAATEQKGIHLVLPVTKDEVHLYEKFLQMYKRVCLQTGENVVLLTVFINIRMGKFEGEEKDDPFLESKNLISRYKHSYMWAQLPWLQVGVKQASPVLIMDIVSMKLPVHSLIFLVSINVYFTTNFLNRCRVNAVSGMQVFFPIPFAEYDPHIVYQTQPKPTFVDIHSSKGFWDRTAQEVACFNNKDYKHKRMRKADFLDENQDSNRTVLNVFSQSDLQVFRALDSELRRTFQSYQCKKMRGFNETLYHACVAHASEKRASRAQFAQIFFEKRQS